MQVMLCVGLACFLQTLTKNFWLAVCGVFLASCSILHLYFLSDFVSNFGALTLLIWGAFGVVKATKEKRSGWWLFAGLTLLAACFSHRSTVGLIFFVFFTLILAKLAINYATNTKRQLVFGLVIAVLIVSPCILAWRSLDLLQKSS